MPHVWSAENVRCLCDLLLLVEEQLQLATQNQSDRAAAVDIAGYAISVVGHQLKRDNALQAKFMLLFDPYLSYEKWGELVGKAPAEFCLTAQELIKAARIGRSVLSAL